MNETDERLAEIAGSPLFSVLERQLAAAVLEDRAVLRVLAEQAGRMGKQIIHPTRNVFTIQVESIKGRLP